MREVLLGVGVYHFNFYAIPVIFVYSSPCHSWKISSRVFCPVFSFSFWGAEFLGPRPMPRSRTLFGCVVHQHSSCSLAALLSLQLGYAPGSSALTRRFSVMRSETLSYCFTLSLHMPVLCCSV